MCCSKRKEMQSYKIHFFIESLHLHLLSYCVTFLFHTSHKLRKPYRDLFSVVNFFTFEKFASRLELEFEIVTQL